MNKDMVVTVAPLVVTAINKLNLKLKLAMVASVVTVVNNSEATVVNHTMATAPRDTRTLPDTTDTTPAEISTLEAA